MAQLLVGQEAQVRVELHDEGGRRTRIYDEAEGFTWTVPEGLRLHDEDADPFEAVLTAETAFADPRQVRVRIDGRPGEEQAFFELVSEDITAREPEPGEAVGGSVTITMVPVEQPPAENPEQPPA